MVAGPACYHHQSQPKPLAGCCTEGLLQSLSRLVMSMVAGPARFLPSALKQLPWQGQLNSLSWGFHCRTQTHKQQKKGSVHVEDQTVDRERAMTGQLNSLS
jgi:hypothetical protein